MKEQKKRVFWEHKISVGVSYITLACNLQNTGYYWDAVIWTGFHSFEIKLTCAKKKLSSKQGATVYQKYVCGEEIIDKSVSSWRDTKSANNNLFIIETFWCDSNTQQKPPLQAATSTPYPACWWKHVVLEWQNGMLISYILAVSLLHSLWCSVNDNIHTVVFLGFAFFPFRPFFNPANITQATLSAASSQNVQVSIFICNTSTSPSSYRIQCLSSIFEDTCPV